jgi:hypothetical protein
LSKLIDSIVATGYAKEVGWIKPEYTHRIAIETPEGNCGWYIAKPTPFYGMCEIVSRIKDAYRVLIGKSLAYHYKEDE